ncbi:MAG: ABC transporter permease [Lachnospiraceae bacterium]|nr:ABC transporter permease [Lachnospiraceae bacterium]
MKQKLKNTNILSTVSSIVIAVLLGCLLILLVSDEPLSAIKSLLVLPLSNTFYMNSIINKVTPLILVGLSASVAFKTGLFNMGVQGQFYMGAFMTAIAGNYLIGLPQGLHIAVVFIAAVGGGVIYATVAGALKAYFNINEVVTTLMLNYIATLMTSGMTNSYFRDPDSGGVIRMHYIPEYLELKGISSEITAHSGILIALGMVVLIYILMKHSTFGYRMETVGQNKVFAQYGGLNIKLITIFCFAVSGGLSGLAGSVEVLGMHRSFFDDFASGMGGDGLIIALLASNHPVGVLLISFFFAYLKVGGQIMQQNTDVSRELVLIIQVIMIMLISSRMLTPYLNKRKFAKEVEKNG